jgi:hypothetical protein
LFIQSGGARRPLRALNTFPLNGLLDRRRDVRPWRPSCSVAFRANGVRERHQTFNRRNEVSVMTKRLAGVSGTILRASLATAACALMLAGPAAAQAPAAGAPPAPPDANPGAITFTGNFDVLPKTPYIFRGLVQEAHPKLTLWPAGDLGIALYSGKEALKSATVNLGVWNSLHTGSSGLDSTSKKLHYEEDFYAALGLGFSKATVTTT